MSKSEASEVCIDIMGVVVGLIKMLYTCTQNKNKNYWEYWNNFCIEYKKSFHKAIFKKGDYYEMIDLNLINIDFNLLKDCNKDEMDDMEIKEKKNEFDKLMLLFLKTL